MHSSRMRAACLLTVSRSIHWGGGSASRGGGFCIHGGLGRPLKLHLRRSWVDCPLDADHPVLWPVMHAGKQPPSRGQTNTRENLNIYDRETNHFNILN